MFETAVLSYDPPTKRVWATFAGFTGQAALIGFALLAPMLWPQVIPRVTWAVQVVGPPPPPPPPPGPAVVARRTKTYSQFVDHRLRQPVTVPDQPVQLTDDEPVVPGGGGVKGGMRNGRDDGVIGSPLIDDILDRGRVLPKMPVAEAREMPRVPPAPPEPPKRIRISELQLAKPIHRVEPVYPVVAKQSRIQGTVQLLGVLGTDGRIHELHAVSGHPLLIPAAMDAVKQWVFAPTILNGQAVEVQAPIQVNFVLNR